MTVTEAVADKLSDNVHTLLQILINSYTELTFWICFQHIPDSIDGSRNISPSGLHTNDYHGNVLELTDWCPKSILVSDMTYTIDENATP